jgi:hypothetical protein
MQTIASAASSGGQENLTYFYVLHFASARGKSVDFNFSSSSSL